ncbi:hypothetical protein AKO1_005014 [Acrasis kona]|uniref:Integral membrane protein n=1 Tax=Acrasis kona TaxID=1008807 RepID=A0AAW2Z3L5_9EUKA
MELQNIESIVDIPEEESKQSEHDRNQPQKHHFHLDTQSHKIIKNPHGGTAVIPLLHPTHTHFQHGTHENLKLEWSARDHRKGRQNIRIHLAEKPKVPFYKRVYDRLPAAKHYIQPLNISWWVAMFFTVGSIVWVVNGFFVFLPYVNSSIYANYLQAALWTAFAGGTLFEVGATLSLIESLHSQKEKVEFDFKPKKRRIYRLYRLKLNLRDLGTIANIVQFFAASIFWISTIAGVVPGVVEDPLGGLAIGLFWTEQVVGGAGFVIASLLLMYETQKKWWMILNLKSIGWHVGFWNLIGAIGFLLSGALGYSSGINYATGYQSGCSTFWGSWAFLIGSVIQLWECIDRNPKKTIVSSDKQNVQSKA